MIHPLFKVLIRDPDLLADHAAAYAALATAEAGEVMDAWRARVLWGVLALGLALTGLLLAGMAALLMAALPWSAMPWPWALPLLPLVCWAAALGAAWRARQPVTQGSAQILASLRDQWTQDMQMLHAAGRS